MRNSNTIALFIAVLFIACGGTQKTHQESDFVQASTQTVTSNQRSTVIVSFTSTQKKVPTSMTGVVIGPHHVLTVLPPAHMAPALQPKGSIEVRIRIYDPMHAKVEKVVKAVRVYAERNTGLTLLRTDHEFLDRVSIGAEDAWTAGAEVFSIDWVYLPSMPKGSRIIPSTVRRGHIISTADAEYLHFNKAYFLDLEVDPKAVGAGVFNHEDRLIGIRWVVYGTRDSNTLHQDFLPTIVIPGSYIAEFLDASGIDYSGKRVDIFDSKP